MTEQVACKYARSVVCLWKWAPVDYPIEPPCPGRYVSSDYEKCLKCPAGKYSFKQVSSSGEIRLSDCLDCPAGKYASEGKPKCTECPKGSFSKATGATSPALCQPCVMKECKAGEEMACTHANNTCVACPQGKYKTKPGTRICSLCVKCPPGYHRWGCKGASEGECIPCPAGYACPGGEQGLTTPMIKCPAARRMGYVKCPEETNKLTCALTKLEAVANQLHTQVHAVGHHEAADK